MFWLITRPIGVQAGYPLWLLDAAPLVLWASVLGMFAYVFSLTLTLAFETRHETRWALALGAVLSVAAVEVAHAEATAPLWPDLEERVNDGAILQSSGSSCAAASGANIATALGVPLTEIEVARAMGSTATGTSTGQMVRGMRELGFTCTPFQLDPGAPDSMPTPSFAFVPLADGFEDGHAIAVLEVSPEQIVVVDPLSGRRERTPEDMVGHWGGRGAHCVVTP